MALLYTDEQKDFINMVKEFADENLSTKAIQKYDQEGECPPELFKPAFDMGLHMLEIPEKYGGAGLSYETTAMIFEKLASYDAGYAITLVSTFVALRSVMIAVTKHKFNILRMLLRQGLLLPLH
jgi:alkylation response protein AidB-like acyl-CoA dehydrogenase